MGNLEAAVATKEIKDCIQNAMINTRTHVQNSIVEQRYRSSTRSANLPLKGTGMLVELLGGRCRVMGRNKKYEGFTRRGPVAIVGLAEGMA